MRERLDVLLCARGLAESREKAKALIMAGEVYVDDVKALKAGDAVSSESRIEVRGGLRYVSRGGLKLEKAMALYELSLTGLICADIGASTGGFTDCMLQNGAERVYAVDVGYGQLAWSLRTDARVVNLERTNVRYVTREQIPDPLDFASVDVSFISLTLVLPVLKSLLKPEGRALCLVKPQFEAGKGKVGKKGVVREPEIHLEVCEKIAAFLAETGWTLSAATYSPIKGPQGNIEYLFLIQNAPSSAPPPDLQRLVAESHEPLN